MMRRVLLFTVVLLLTGCADKRIALIYAPDASAAPLTGAQPITVFAFNDARGAEGDQDPYRVGGVYGGYGNRLSKVMVDTPFNETVVNALVAAFVARKVDAQGRPAQAYGPGATVTTPLVLTGDMKNFSTEARYTNSAHISGVVRVLRADGGVLLEKEISERERTNYGGGGVLTDTDDLAAALNAALARWVLKVVTDPDIAARLAAR